VQKQGDKWKSTAKLHLTGEGATTKVINKFGAGFCLRLIMGGAKDYTGCGAEDSKNGVIAL